MKKFWCFFGFHNYGKIKDLPKHYYDEQERICLDCGKTQKRIRDGVSYFFGYRIETWSWWWKV
jgi:hypothetical protein